jgi:tetratricopeptide (TPR) repeat protein
MSIASYYFIFLNTTIMKLILQWGLELETAFKAFSAVLLILGVVIYFRFLFGYFMRNFERQADGYVFRLFPTAQPLINTFGKIVTTSGQSADKPNWHHFSIRQRVDFLKQCETAPHQILRHDRKMHKSIAAFLAGLALLALAVMQFNQFIDRQTNRGLTIEALAAYLDHKQLQTKEDALLYMMLGNLFYEQQQATPAAEAYEKGLQLNPDHADILNNLAWLLATIPEGPTYDPDRALTLAQKAVALKKAPHIWDTLAQSLFANGRVAEAVQAEQAALAMNPRDRQIYETQLAKFKEALMQE